MVSALRLQHLVVRGFRNLREVVLRPGPQFNVLYGDNGAGKTSLLEAIHYLSALASFRGAKTADLVTQGLDDALLGSTVQGAGSERQVRVVLHRTAVGRELKLDGKRPRSLASWQSALQVVLFHPGHLEIASGAPDTRRAFLDRILEQIDPTYAATLASYVKALRSRNRLLRQDRVDRASVSAFDELLASAGAILGQTRAALVSDLAPLATDAFVQVVSEDVPLTIQYRPRVAPDVEAIREALARSLTKDIARGFTAEGPHADELELSIRESKARHHASQGQHRAIVLALKVAELHALTRRKGHVPVLLLDDVSSELDRARNRRFFALLASLGGQVFLTTTHPEFILLDEGRVNFTVHEGRIDPAP